MVGDAFAGFVRGPDNFGARFRAGAGGNEISGFRGTSLLKSLIPFSRMLSEEWKGACVLDDDVRRAAGGAAVVRQ